GPQPRSAGRMDLSRNGRAGAVPTRGRPAPVAGASGCRSPTDLTRRQVLYVVCCMVDDEALAAARERYRAERQKRLRDDGLAQYQELHGDYEEFDRDPWAEPGFTRDPVTEDVDVVVLGAGYGGLFNAIGLLQRGVTNIRIVEK